ncbi:MAG: ATP-binding cassette domain-containing protein, partial [Chlamydiae bacterium]|nr:ATP-binding cassette domain-containing protein [Chlamydiota bacterium]
MFHVKTKKLSKWYGSQKALQSIDLEVQAGSIYGIIGFSGAGKSTLLRCLVGLEEPTEGSVEVSGEIGMIFQHFNLFGHLTAVDNVLFANPDRKRAFELLKQVGLEGLEQLYPAQMSGGQKQRVAIARALANHPKVLFCDEATSALDPETTQSILELLLNLNQELGLTIVLITHEMEVVKSICHEVAVLDGGEVVEKGAVADLFATPKHPTTRRFLETIRHESQFETKGELLRLLFRQQTAGKPIISQLVRESNADINILLGGIDVLKEETIGTLLVEVTGSYEQRQKVHE